MNPDWADTWPGGIIALSDSVPSFGKWEWSESLIGLGQDVRDFPDVNSNVVICAQQVLAGHMFIVSLKLKPGSLNADWLHTCGILIYGMLDSTEQMK